MQVGEGAVPRLHAARGPSPGATHAAGPLACPAAAGEAKSGRMEAGHHRRSRTLLRHLPERSNLSFPRPAISAGPGIARMLTRYVFDLGVVEPWSTGRLVNFLTNHPASKRRLMVPLTRDPAGAPECAGRAAQAQSIETRLRRSVLSVQRVVCRAPLFGSYSVVESASMYPFAAFLLGISTLVAAAQTVSSGPPKLDIAGACRDMAAQHDAATRADAIKSCVASEDKARKELEAKWSRYDPSVRTSCLGTAAVGTSVKPVYSELIGCLEMRSR
jgi:hypothetical protein